MMKVSVEEISQCKRALIIEVPVESVRSKLEEAYRRLSRTAVLPGFRKGRVPRELLKRRFKSEVTSEVVRELIAEASNQALQEVKLQPISEPTVEEVTFEEDRPLRFKVGFEVKPSIALNTYKGIGIFKERVTVSEEEVDRVLRLLQEQSAEYVPMEGWPALRDDLVIVDYEGSIGGKPVKGGRGENVTLILGSRTFPPGFEESLYGLQKGETKVFTLDIPPDHPWRDLAGRKVNFKVTVKEIKKKRVPPLDDEFARSKGCENLEELRGKLRQELLLQKEREEEERVKERILEKVLEAHPFDPPDVLVEMELEHLLSEVPSPPREEGETFRARLRKVAERRVKASLLLEAIADAEGIKVEEEEVEQEVKRLATVFNQDETRLYSLLNRTGRLEGIKARLRERKTLEFLYREARITESFNIVTP